MSDVGEGFIWRGVVVAVVVVVKRWKDREGEVWKMRNAGGQQEVKARMQGVHQGHQKRTTAKIRVALTSNLKCTCIPS